MFLTQEQIDTLSQNLRHKRLRLEILDSNMVVIDTIEGYAIDGNIEADADNDIRRSGTIQMVIPTDLKNATLIGSLDGYVIESGGKIWLDKNIKISVGIDNILSTQQETIWYKLGVFLINKPVMTTSATQFELSFECIDLMARLTGQRQGQLPSTSIVIEAGYYQTNTQTNETEYIRTQLADALISTITELGGISKYSIYQIPERYKYLQYDVKFEIGTTVYNILSTLKGMLPTWQMYFDLDGVLIIEPIPNGKNGIIYDLDKQQYISDSMSVDFENVKNQVVIYGRTNNLTYFTENTDLEPNNVQYITNNDGVTATLLLKYQTVSRGTLTTNGTTFGFLSREHTNTLPITQVEIWSDGTQFLYSHDSVNISLVKFENSTNSFGVDYQTTQIEANSILENEIYFIRIYEASLTSDEYVDTTQSIVFDFMGKQTVSYNLVNDNKDSPFYINSNYTNENYYCGTATTPNGANWGESYDIVLNDNNGVTTISEGTIITFIANAPNIYASDTNYTTVNVYNSLGSLILSNVPLVQNLWVANDRPYLSENKLIGDYTILELRYEVVNGNNVLVYLGRCRNALTKIFSGGSYDNIYTDQIAYENCLLQLFNCSNMNDNIDLQVVPNYLIDVNCRIIHNNNNAYPININERQQFISEDSDNNGQYKQFMTAYNNEFYVIYNQDENYLTKKINYPLGVDNNPQSITAIKIYDSGNLMGEDY